MGDQSRRVDLPEADRFARSLKRGEEGEPKSRDVATWERPFFPVKGVLKDHLVLSTVVFLSLRDVGVLHVWA